MEKESFKRKSSINMKKFPSSSVIIIYFYVLFFLQASPSDSTKLESLLKKSEPKTSQNLTAAEQASASLFNYTSPKGNDKRQQPINLVPAQQAAKKADIKSTINLSAASSNEKSIRVDSRTGKAIARMQPGKRQVSGSEQQQVSRRNEDPWFLDQAPYPLQPYRFVYNIKGKNGQTEQYRQEVGDGKFLSGSYGYVLPDGIYRHVDYVADDRGFRAFIRTSEPGTANQNPSNVVINSNPVTGPVPGVNYANYQSATPIDFPLPAIRQTIPQEPELVRRPPGSIINTSLRNFTSYTFTTPSPFSNLEFINSNNFEPIQSPNTTTSWNNKVNHISQLPDEGLFKRLKPTLAPWSAGGDQRGQTQGRDQSPAAFDNYQQRLGLLNPQDYSSPTTTPSPLHANNIQYGQLPSSQAIGQTPLRVSSYTNLFPTPATRAGSNVLLYDRPLSLQPVLPATKLHYDNNHILHPDLPYLSLERERHLAQIEQLNAIRPTSNLHYIRPPQPASQVTNLLLPPARPLTTTTTTSGYFKSQSESSHSRSEVHKEFDENDANKVTLNASKDKEHHSGTKSGSSREFEYHNTNDLNANRLPPPAPQFNHNNGVKGLSSRLQAPYTSGFSRQTQQQQELSSPKALLLINQGNIETGLQEPVAPRAPEEPSRPALPSSPPPPPANQEQQATKGSQDQAEPSSSSSIRPDDEPGRAQPTPEPSSQAIKSGKPIRATRNNLDDYRSNMIMNDLRSMQNTLGLPQPPRIQRQSPLTDGHDHFNNFLNSRINRIDAAINGLPLVETSHRESHGSRLQIPQGSANSGAEASSVRRSVAVSAQDQKKPAASNGAEAQASNKLKLSTGPVIKMSQPEQVISSINDNLVIEPSQDFDARRLSKLGNKLQAEKVSELEKFQQRLRTQQLLLEHAKSNSSERSPSLSSPKPAAKQQLKPSPEAQHHQEPASALNSHVKYDEELDPNNHNQLSSKDLSRLIRQGGDPQQDGFKNNSISTSRKLNAINSNKTYSGSNSAEPPRSSLAQQLQKWPSLSAENRTDLRQPAGATGDSSTTTANQTRPEVKPGNTINLDFINSVTALSMDHLNPFAISSVNPSVQQQHSRLSPHRLEPSSGGGVAITNARYFNSPELLSALEPSEPSHIAPDSAPRQPGWASNHRYMGAAASSSAPYMLLASAVDQKLINTRKLLGGNKKPAAKQSSLVRDGFEVRDRAIQLDNQQFFEVISSASPSANSDSFQAFRG